MSLHSFQHGVSIGNLHGDVDATDPTALLPVRERQPDIGAPVIGRDISPEALRGSELSETELGRRVIQHAQRKHELRVAKVAERALRRGREDFIPDLSDLFEEKLYLIDVLVAFTGIYNGQDQTEKQRYSKEFAKRITEAQANDLINSPADNFLIEEIKASIGAKFKDESVDWGRVEVLSVREIPESDFGDITMLGETYNYVSLDDEGNFNFDSSYGDCVPTYLAQECCHADKKLTIENVKRQLDSIKESNKPGYTTNDIKKWIDKYFNKASLYAFDPTLKMFEKKISNSHHEIIQLMFIVNNNHIYPIRDVMVKDRVRYTNKIEFTRTKWKEYNDYVYGDPVEVMNGKEYGKTNVIIDDNNDMNIILAKVLENEKAVLSPRDIHVKGEKIVGFVHPKGHIVVTNNRWRDRKRLMDSLYKLIPCENLKFRNQGWGGIAMQMYEIKYGRIPTSFINDQSKAIFDKYEPSALCFKLKSEMKKEERYMYDHRSSYTYAITHNQLDYPIYSFTDRWEEWDGEMISCGEYFCKAFIEKVNGQMIPHEAGAYNACLINPLIRNEYMHDSVITHCKRPTGRMKHDTFNDFVDYCDKITNGNAKLLINPFIGLIGQKYKSFEEVATTMSESVAFSLMGSLCSDNKLDKVIMSTIGDVHIIRRCKKTLMKYNCRSIYRQIICNGLLNVTHMVEQICKPETRLLAIRTDCLYLQGPHNEPDNDDPRIRVQKGEWKPPKKRFALSREMPVISLTISPWNEIAVDDDTTFEGSFLCLGPGGCGKSTQIKRMYDSSDSTTVHLCFTNSACERLRELGIKAMTLDCYFAREPSSKLTSMVLDEVSMIPPKFWNKIWDLVVTRGINVQAYGDMNQLPPVADKYIDYMEKEDFRAIFNHKLYRKSFIDGGRCSRELHDLAMEVLTTKKVPEILKDRPINKDLKQNIVKFNKTRERIIEKQHPKLVTGDMVLVDGKNFHSAKVYNSGEYMIEDITDLKIKVNGTWLPRRDKVMEFFVANNAKTIHKSQGRTISGPFNIYNTSHLSVNSLYTSLTRARTIDQIHIEWFDGELSVDVEDPSKYIKVVPEKLKLNKEKNYYYLTAEDKKRYETMLREQVVKQEKKKDAPLEIKEMKDWYSIAYYEDGKRKFATSRWSKRTSKKQALCNIKKKLIALEKRLFGI